MRTLRNALVAGLIVLGLSGCGSTRVASCEDGRDVLWFDSASNRMLEKATASYEAGNYGIAMTQLQAVIDFPSASTEEKIESYKLSAFIHCVSSREAMCRDAFKKAIALDPAFDLTPAEIGHPVWGPVFGALKKNPAKP